MKIVVTGSESFIGHALVPLALDHGIEVAGIDTAPPTFAGGRVGDIRTPAVADLFRKGPMPSFISRPFPATAIAATIHGWRGMST